MILYLFDSGRLSMIKRWFSSLRGLMFMLTMKINKQIADFFGTSGPYLVYVNLVRSFR